MSIAIITGASSGIGREFVNKLSSYFNNITEIWAVARRENLLNELKTVGYKDISGFKLKIIT